MHLTPFHDLRLGRNQAKSNAYLGFCSFGALFPVAETAL